MGREFRLFALILSLVIQCVSAQPLEIVPVWEHTLIDQANWSLF